MARMPRLAVAGLPHLVIQRSAVGTAALGDDADRRDYLAALGQAARDTGAAVHAYALLPEAVFLLVTPVRGADLGRLMLRLNRRFVPAFHRRHGGHGELWAGRFEAAAIDPEHYLLPAMLLVEQAPVRAGLAGAAKDWPWSSAGHHVGRGASPLVTGHTAYWRIGNTPFEREARHDTELQQLLRTDVVEGLLGAARGGWPHGSPAFVDGLAASAGRAVRPRARGRPPRSD